MAREMNKKVRPFRLENSDAIEENERILEAGSQQRQKNREAEQAEQVEQVEQANSASTESTASEAATASTTSTASTPAPVTQEPEQIDTPASRFDLQGKKTSNGIVVNVPMDDYMQLTMMKFQTGRTLKDLALQAIHEFVERNK